MLLVESLATTCLFLSMIYTEAYHRDNSSFGSDKPNMTSLIFLTKKQFENDYVSSVSDMLK